MTKSNYLGILLFVIVLLPAQKGGAMGQRRRVLVVENYQPSAKLFREYFKLKGLKVSQALDLREAKRLFTKKKYHAVLVDGSIDTDKDGLEFVSGIRKTGFRGLVVGISGCVYVNQELVDAGADKAVIKLQALDLADELKAL